MPPSLRFMGFPLGLEFWRDVLTYSNLLIGNEGLEDDEVSLIILCRYLPRFASKVFSISLVVLLQIKHLLLPLENPPPLFFLKKKKAPAQYVSTHI